MTRFDLPADLAGLHARTPVGAVVELVLEGSPRRVTDVVVGAGFEVVASDPPRVTVKRLRTLPDHVGPGMRVLVCGLNPSLYAADHGVNFARPGNRFWPAMLAAGLVSMDRDPVHALRHHGVGMTDLVKRATVAASELRAEEYVDGVARVERLCTWLQPAAVGVVGLAGWRAAVDRGARTGWQSCRLGGVPVYVMPSTSGLNASTQHAGFVEHLRAVATGREGPARGSGT